MPFLPSNQQCQSTEGDINVIQKYKSSLKFILHNADDIIQLAYINVMDNCLQSFDAVGWTAGRVSAGKKN